MKKRYTLLFVILLSTILLWGCQNIISNIHSNAIKQAVASAATEQKIATSTQSFGLDVFKNLAENSNGKNIFISPLSLSMALAMTTNGAKGDTRTAMLKALQIPDLNVSQMDTSYQKLIKQITTADPSVQMNLANAIWYRNSFSVEQSFIQTCQNYFNAQVKGLDFTKNSAADTINNWVNNETNGKITQMVNPPIPPDVMMYLMNAIYFKGNWRLQFVKKNTKPENFTLSDDSTVKPEMMRMVETMPYYQSQNVQMLDMAYGDSTFSMDILLPPKGTPINTFIANLTKSKLNNWINKLQNTKVYISIPRFEASYDTTFKQVLSKMGMGIVFQDNANFSGINKTLGLKISQVIQKSYIKVDEQGTEASAATL